MEVGPGLLGQLGLARRCAARRRELLGVLARALLRGGGGGALLRVEQLSGGLEPARHAVARGDRRAEPRLHLVERRRVPLVGLVPGAQRASRLIEIATQARRHLLRLPLGRVHLRQLGGQRLAAPRRGLELDLG